MGLASLDRITATHSRHDGVLDNLLAAARRLAAGRPDPGDLDAVRAAVTYLEDIVPRYYLDEEGSVFPRLSTRRPELASELARLSAEHPTQIRLHAEVAAAARALGDEVRPGAGMALLDVATRLADAHRAQQDRKDAVFRVASEALTAEDDVEIFAEMTTRRDRDDGPAVRRPRAKSATVAATPRAFVKTAAATPVVVDKLPRKAKAKAATKKATKPGARAKPKAKAKAPAKKKPVKRRR